MQNAVPLIDFQTIHPTYDTLSPSYQHERHLITDKENTVIISPDTGARIRPSIMQEYSIDIDFSIRKDYTRIVNGKNPIVQHEYWVWMLQAKM